MSLRKPIVKRFDNGNPSENLQTTDFRKIVSVTSHVRNMLKTVHAIIGKGLLNLHASDGVTLYARELLVNAKKKCLLMSFTKTNKHKD